MPWFPIKGVVEKLRNDRKWDRKILARKSGVKVRTIRNWESDSIPHTGQDETVRGFAAAFGVEPEAIANWHHHDPALDDGLGGAGTDAPAKSTLAVRAERDEYRELITHNSDQIEVVRPRLLRRLQTASGLYENQRFAFIGRVRDSRDMPPIVGAQLGLTAPLCGQFLFVRRFENGDIGYASPFTRCAEDTKRLLDATELKTTLTIIARVTLRPADEAKKWKGFVFFQKKGESPKLHNWCFLIEEILEGGVATSPGELEEAEIEPVLKKKPGGRARSRRIADC
jgi:transcriptional regulator with XRE-family HTH domain